MPESVSVMVACRVRPLEAGKEAYVTCTNQAVYTRDPEAPHLQPHAVQVGSVGRTEVLDDMPPLLLRERDGGVLVVRRSPLRRRRPSARASDATRARLPARRCVRPAEPG